MNEIKEVVLEPLDIKQMSITVQGNALLMDKFPERVKDEIIAKQTGEKRIKKSTRDIDREVKEAIHKTNDGQVGYPAAGFKLAMMDIAASFTKERKGNTITKKLVSGALRVVNQVDGLIPIKYKKQDVLEHQVFENTKYSPQFHDWEAELVFKYDATSLSPQDITTLLNYAGFRIGIGAWRPKGRKGGSGEYGMFQVKSNGQTV